MIQALDTNVLLDVLIPNEAWFRRSLEAIQAASARGSLVVCDLVYAELATQFNQRADCDRFLEENRIGVDRLERESLWRASRAWREYRKRAGKRDRLLTDFLVGAHAACQAACLVTRDRGFYRDYFKELVIVAPEA